jgi:UDP-glucose 6-dehydrogenase
MGRYTSRVKQYKQNALFQTNCKELYKQLNGKGNNLWKKKMKPATEEMRMFWNEIET